MKVEELDSVAVYVRNLGEAVSFFSDLFETSFIIDRE